MLDPSHQLSLKLMQRCPSCFHGLINRNIQILKETEEIILAHISCQRCQNQYISRIVNSSHGIIGNAIITDMSFAEASRLFDSAPLSDDEFLAIFQSIKDQSIIESFNLEFKTRKEK